MQDFGSINPALSMAQRVHTAIASAAQDTGVDFGYLLGQARIESSLNPRAKSININRIGAVPVYQANLARHDQTTR